MGCSREPTTRVPRVKPTLRPPPNAEPAIGREGSGSKSLSGDSMACVGLQPDSI